MFKKEQIELRELHLRYGDLRIIDKDCQNRLAASIRQYGQQTPVLVIEDRGQLVLIDGYQRVNALKQLSYDLIDITRLGLSICDGLVMALRLSSTRSQSVLEEGWLIQELIELHGWNQKEVGLRLNRKKSWISRRLGVVSILPQNIQNLVQQGKIPAAAALRTLLPWCRVDSEACSQVVAAVATRQLSNQEWMILYKGWTTLEQAGRTRLVKYPLLYLKTHKTTQSDKNPLVDKLVKLQNLSSAVQRQLKNSTELSNCKQTHQSWKKTIQILDAMK